MITSRNVKLRRGRETSKDAELRRVGDKIKKCITKKGER